MNIRGLFDQLLVWVDRLVGQLRKLFADTHKAIINALNTALTQHISTLPGDIWSTSLPRTIIKYRRLLRALIGNLNDRAGRIVVDSFADLRQTYPTHQQSAALDDLWIHVRPLVASVNHSATTVFNKAITSITATGAEGDVARRRAIDTEIATLRQRGILHYRDNAGRLWQLENYAAIVADRHAIDTAIRVGTQQLAAQGVDLVTVDHVDGACPKCGLWQRKTLSLAGTTPGYPTLTQARTAGLYHPGCRHRLTPVEAT